MPKGKNKAALRAKCRAGTSLGRKGHGETRSSREGTERLSGVLPGGGELRNTNVPVSQISFLGNSMASMEICPRAWNRIRCGTEEPREGQLTR